MTPVSVTVDLRAASPAYEQVRAQLGGHIRSGTLPPGTKLPVVRALASDLGVAVNTIARAYQELEREGLVTTRRRVGTIVCDGLPVVPPEVGAAVKRLAQAARDADLPLDTVLDLVRGRLSLGSAGDLPGR
jgi:GntR family transcriptional regulator